MGQVYRRLRLVAWTAACLSAGCSAAVELDEEAPAAEVEDELIAAPLVATPEDAAVSGSSELAASATSNFVLFSRSNGLCLEPENGSTEAGAAIVQRYCTFSPAQQWTKNVLSSTVFQLVNVGSGLCMETREGAVNGASIDLWPCNWISNLKWSHGQPESFVSRVSGTSSHCLTARSGADEGPITLWRCDRTTRQRWGFVWP